MKGLCFCSDNISSICVKRGKYLLHGNQQIFIYIQQKCVEVKEQRHVLAYMRVYLLDLKAACSKGPSLRW